MLAERLKGEAGYSLVEVMVSILILAIAIMPMVKMFDVGLQSATRGGYYDQARALAQKELETVQSNDYLDVKSSFPTGCPGGTAAFDQSGLSDSTNCTNSDFPGFTFEVRKQFLKLPNASGTYSCGDLNGPTCRATDDNGVMNVTVTVSGNNGLSYTVRTLKTSGKT